MATSEHDLILQQAHSAVVQREYPAVYELYENLLKINPDDSQVLLEYGKAVYYEFVDLDRAIGLFEKAWEKDPSSVEALLWFADVAAMGYGPDHVGAVSLYRQAIELDPTCSDAYVGLGLQYQAPDVTLSLEEAIEAFRTASILDPQRYDAPMNLGMTLLNKGDTEGARSALLQAIELLGKMNRTNQLKQIQSLRKYVEKIDRHEQITGRSLANDSRRYSWFSKDQFK